MAHSNGVITAPVGIDADIAPVLGVGSYDLGYLCSNAHGKINKWSYIKPKEANTPDFNNANLPGLIYDSAPFINLAMDVGTKTGNNLVITDLIYYICGVI